MKICVKQMNENDYQAMPRSGRLAKALNLDCEDLSEKIAPFRQDTVYSYVIKTVECKDGRLRQWGSAPNFQGGLITLCSCMHRMRTSLQKTNSWKGLWIAGYTPKDLGNHLFYLMRVSEAFASHHELWFSNCIPKATRIKKAAHLDRFGDIYKPKSESVDPYRYRDYIRPCKGHVHREPPHWHKDINYSKGYQQRKPALLVGHPEYSFLWDKPEIVSPFVDPRHPRQKKTKLSVLFPSLLL